jgi:hypothetical protein
MPSRVVAFWFDDDSLVRVKVKGSLRAGAVVTNTRCNHTTTVSLGCLSLFRGRRSQQQLRPPPGHAVAFGLPMLAEKQTRDQIDLVLAELLVHLPAGAVLAIMASSSAWSLIGLRR